MTLRPMAIHAVRRELHHRKPRVPVNWLRGAIGELRGADGPDGPEAPGAPLPGRLSPRRGIAQGVIPAHLERAVLGLQRNDLTLVELYGGCMVVPKVSWCGIRCSACSAVAASSSAATARACGATR
jgi:hypothetical protein